MMTTGEDGLMGHDTPLPDKFSDLLLQGVEDGHALVGDSAYTPHYNHWICQVQDPYEEEGDGECLVCFAGATMVRQMGGSVHSAEPSDFVLHWDYAFRAMNYFREGYFQDAVELWVWAKMADPETSQTEAEALADLPDDYLPDWADLDWMPDTWTTASEYDSEFEDRDSFRNFLDDVRTFVEDRMIPAGW